MLKKYFKEGKLNPTDVFISSFDWNELELFYRETKEVPIAVPEDDPLDAIPVALSLDALPLNPQHKA